VNPVQRVGDLTVDNTELFWIITRITIIMQILLYLNYYVNYAVFCGVKCNRKGIGCVIRSPISQSLLIGKNNSLYISKRVGI